LLYAFSWYSGKSTLSLLDTDGNSKWQYSTPDGHEVYSNTINYKEIDTSTDMVIATSGNLYINYNRIIHSSSSPYSVGGTVIFRDPTANSNRRLYALCIKDMNNAVSLIYDVSNGVTDLATLEF
jgi:outer membrane protein assembly factor BamB